MTPLSHLLQSWNFPDMNNKGSCLTFNSLINLFPKMNAVLHRGFSVRRFSILELFFFGFSWGLLFHLPFYLAGHVLPSWIFEESQWRHMEEEKRDTVFALFWKHHTFCCCYQTKGQAPCAWSPKFWAISRAVVCTPACCGKELLHGFYASPF